MLAEVYEITPGLVLVGLLGVVGPLAVVGGVFVAWGKLRTEVDQNRRRVENNEGEVQRLREAIEAARADIRRELDAHASVLSTKIDNAEGSLKVLVDRTTHSHNKRLGSLERWRERLAGYEEAMRVQAAQGIPQQLPPRDPTPTPIDIPVNRPGSLHRRTGTYHNDDSEDS